MKNLLNYLYNSKHKNSTDIKFDDQFGNEKEVEYLVSKLVEHGIVSINYKNYTEIQVKVEQVINIIAKDFDYNLDKFIQSQQKPYSNNMTFNAPVNGSQLNQGSLLGNFDLSHNSISSEKNKHIAQPNDEAITTSKNDSIWTKFYNITNHKLFGKLIYGAIVFMLLCIWTYFKLPTFWK